MTDNLVSGLSDQIARVSLKAERWRSMRDDKAFPMVGLSLGLAVMDATLTAARDALASGDIATMAQAYQALKDYSDDD